MFPYKFYKKTRHSFMVWFNICFLLVSVIGLNYYQIHHYKKILTFLQNNLERFRLPYLGFNHQNHKDIEKIKIIDKDQYYDLIIYLGNNPNNNLIFMDKFQEDLLKISNYKINFTQSNGKSMIVIYNIVEKNHIHKIIDIING
jgi:hypothetical protein